MIEREKIRRRKSISVRSVALCGSASERTKISHVVTPMDREQRLVARGMMRAVLESYLDVQPSRVELTTAPYGKLEQIPI